MPTACYSLCIGPCGGVGLFATHLDAISAAGKALLFVGRHFTLVVNTVLIKRIPRKTLLIPSAVGLFAMLAVMTKGRALTQVTLWLLVTFFVLAVAIELVAIPLALWRMLIRPMLRTRVNALCVTIAAIFLLSVVLEFAF